MTTDLAQLRDSPLRAVDRLNRQLTGDGAQTSLVHHDATLVVIEVRFDPPPQGHLPGYPAERVRLNVRPSGVVGAVPVNGNRPWLHRYPHHTPGQVLADPDRAFSWPELTGPLCLQYPLDPRHLRWDWPDGLDTYVRVVQRHLWSEEYWRRRGAWPVEDAPHGTPADGAPHPVVTPELSSAC